MHTEIKQDVARNLSPRKDNSDPQPCEQSAGKLQLQNPKLKQYMQVLCPERNDIGLEQHTPGRLTDGTDDLELDDPVDRDTARLI